MKDLKNCLIGDQKLNIAVIFPKYQKANARISGQSCKMKFTIVCLT